jgi:hypothetical protein
MHLIRIQFRNAIFRAKQCGKWVFYLKIERCSVIHVCAQFVISANKITTFVAALSTASKGFQWDFSEACVMCAIWRSKLGTQICLSTHEPKVLNKPCQLNSPPASTLFRTHTSHLPSIRNDRKACLQSCPEFRCD